MQPGGTGKTHLAKAAAYSGAYSFFNVTVDIFMSKWQGESEKILDIIFDHARENSPSIIFIDEIDSICMARGTHDSESTRRVKSKLLTEMEGFEKRDSRVIVIGTTNR